MKKSILVRIKLLADVRSLLWLALASFVLALVAVELAGLLMPSNFAQ